MSPLERCTVRLLPSGLQQEVLSGTTLFQAVRAIGAPLASSCNAEGVCARCGIHVLAGMEQLSSPSELERRLLARVDSASAELRMACLAHVFGPVTLTTSYW